MLKPTSGFLLKVDSPLQLSKDIVSFFDDQFETIIPLVNCIVNSIVVEPRVVLGNSLAFDVIWATA